jgi:NAD(P)-dependent dehydrogenase (short-subunit alcohol dehydrogenase family)
MEEKEKHFPPQHQERQPGVRSEMTPKPESIRPDYRGSDKLKDKVALITGGDSGIGRAVAIAFAREGADIALVYLEEHQDAKEARSLVEKEGRRCIVMSGDVGDEDFCRASVKRTLKTFDRLDVLVNNAAEQHEYDSLLDISREQLERTFKTNIFAMYFMTKAALPHLKSGAAIINSTSVTAYQGHPKLLDYAATKGAIVAFTRSLAIRLAAEDIRVNAVAPGPIWTPLVPASFSEEHVSEFGGNTPMGRAGQPSEIAPCYVFLASRDASYMTGQVLHPNGGRIVNS